MKHDIILTYKNIFQPVRCDECCSLFQSYSLLKKHQGPELNNPIPCGRCSNQFNGLCELFRHECEQQVDNNIPQ